MPSRRRLQPKLLPEARENASYKQDVEDLNTALAAKKISQEQFNQTSERLGNTRPTLRKSGRSGRKPAAGGCWRR
jgi:hypothetical protein